MTHLEDNRHRPVRSARTETADPPDHELLLAAEHAVDIGARIFRQGRAHIGALIAKGDRDFATSVDLQIESAIRTSLATATPAIPFLGEEHGGGGAPGKPEWVLDPIDGTINFARDSPLCTISLSLVRNGQPHRALVQALYEREPGLVEHIGEVTGYTDDEASLERGQRLDARAWLLIRGWIKPVVKVPVLDVDDPAPYWVVSTRNPDRLVRVLNEARLAPLP